MAYHIDCHIKASPEQAKDALSEKLSELWKQSQSSNSPQEYFILFEYGNQKTLLKAEFSPDQNDNVRTTS